MSDDSTITTTAPTPAPPAPSSDAPVHDGPDALRDAAGEVFRRRRDSEAAADTAEQPTHAGQDARARQPPPVIEYSGAEPPENVRPRDAARDLSAFRQQRRQDALVDLLGEEAAREAEAAAPDGAPGEVSPDSVSAADQQAQQRLAAHEQALHQARAQYEQAALSTAALLDQVATAQFPEIRSWADVDRLAATNPERHAQFLGYMRTFQAAAAQHQQAIQQRTSEEREQFARFAQRQDELAQERVAELRDPATRERFQHATADMLREVGVSDAELVDLYHGRAGFSLRDARAQAVIADAVRWRMAQARARDARAQPLPQPQRPGVASARGAAHAAHLVELERGLDRAGTAQQGMRAGARLIAARRAAARR